MSRHVSTSNLPWDEAERPVTPTRMAGDVAMTSPSTSRTAAAPGPPQILPEPSTPTQSKKRKGKKCKDSSEHLASQPRPPPSAANSDAEGEAPTSALHPPPPPSVAPSASSSSRSRPLMSTLPRGESGRMLENLDRVSTALFQWSDMDWEDPRDKMRVSWAFSLLIEKTVSLGWHTIPFSDSPGSHSLLTTLRGLVPKDPPATGVTPVLIRGTADSAAQPHPPSGRKVQPRSSALPFPPARLPTGGPGTTGPPQRPPRSSKRPPPPVPAASQRSYADTVKKATDLVTLTRTMPDLEPERIVAMHQAAISSATATKQRINSTTTGPSRRQILVSLPRDLHISGATFPGIVAQANRALDKSSLEVESVHFAYGGISLLTSRVPSPAEIALLAGAVGIRLNLREPPSASLPRSRTFMKILDVPYYMQDDKGKTLSIDSAFIRRILVVSHLAPHIDLANSPRIMRNARGSDTATVWFDIHDSQSGAARSALAGKSIQFGSHSCLIHGAKANPGSPLCQRCWRWGHSTRSCRVQTSSCPQCAGPHSEANHRSHAACCKEQPDATPPVAATPFGIPCPHESRCVNCHSLHAANDKKKCPFWRHRFDREWISRRYSAVSAGSKPEGWRRRT